MRLTDARARHYLLKFESFFFCDFEKCHKQTKKSQQIFVHPSHSQRMISIFSIIWILSLVNCIRADQCTQTSPCSCNYESGFGYDLHALEKEMFEAFVPNITGIQYILNLCSDKTIRPNYVPILQDNCDPGFAVTNEEAITVSGNI